jgi:IclR family KDG regulon transcriptional repressor
MFPMPSEGSSSVHRAIAVLLALGADDAIQQGSVGVVQIARQVGREKSQVSRTLKVLAEAGLVDRDPDTMGYRLGWRLFTLAANAADQRLLASAPAVMRRLVAVSGERSHLSVLEQGGVLTVLSRSPLRAVQTAGWVGRLTPVHVTSSGRALLFDHDPDDVRAMLADADFSTVGPGGPRDVEDFLERLEEARARGYVLSNEEFEPGLVAAGAPVRDARNRVIAALNVSAPKFRMGRQLHKMGRLVAAAAQELSAEVSGRSSRPAEVKNRAADS